jgi:hypothetical protein
VSIPTIQPLPKLTAPENLMPWASRLITELWKRLYSVADGINRLKIPMYTTTQRNELVAEEGLIIYNTTTTQLEMYISGSWGAV